MLIDLFCLRHLEEYKGKIEIVNLWVKVKEVECTLVFIWEFVYEKKYSNIEIKSGRLDMKLYEKNEKMYLFEVVKWYEEWMYRCKTKTELHQSSVWKRHCWELLKKHRARRAKNKYMLLDEEEIRELIFT